MLLRGLARTAAGFESTLNHSTCRFVGCVDSVLMSLLLLCYPCSSSLTIDSSKCWFSTCLPEVGGKRHEWSDWHQRNDSIQVSSISTPLADIGILLMSSLFRRGRYNEKRVLPNPYFKCLLLALSSCMKSSRASHVTNTRIANRLNSCVRL